MLVNMLSMATILYTWSWRRIHRTIFSNPCHIRAVCTTAKKSQANAACERMHQMVGNVLRTLLHGEPPWDIMASAKEYINKALPIAMHTMRAAIHSTLGSSLGSLTFNRDMFFNIPLTADWHAITQRWEHLIHENIIQENQKRHQYNYVPQQRVLKKKWKPCKLGKRTSGPYNVSGTLAKELRQGVSERLNIRRDIPYKEPTATWIQMCNSETKIVHRSQVSHINIDLQHRLK